MDLIDIVKSYLSNYVSLNEQEFRFLGSLFELRNFGKREKLVEEGEVEKYLNFILQGLARKFFIRKNEEMVMQFSRENEIICCYDSFMSGEPSNFSFEALEPMVVVSITHDNVEKLYEFSPKMERLGRLIATQEYLKKESFEYNRVRLTSQERLNSYQQSLEENKCHSVTRLGYIHRTKEIVRIVKEEGADMLVIGAHGHTGLKDFIYGETVNTVRHELKIPVLIVHL